MPGLLFMAADYTREIEQLETLINSGAKGVSADGMRTDFDLDSAKRRLAELRRLQGDDQSKVKRKVASLNLGGCW